MAVGERKKKIRTGIFGGTFNPVHNGHVALAARILKAARLDEVWLLLTPQNPWKKDSVLLDDDQRLAMLQAAVKDEKGLVASDFEFSLPKPSYTWNTLQALTTAYPDRRFTLIIGADNWVGFNRWYEHDKILAHHHIVVYPRSGSDVDAATLPRNVRLLKTELYEVSSTEVRNRVSQGLPIDHLVPSSVATLISQKGYYLSSPQNP